MFQKQEDHFIIDQNGKLIPDFCRTPKHYGFYILHVQQLFEFTPYQICFRQQNDIEQVQKMQLDGTNLGKLIQSQKSYSIEMQKEIRKYEDEQLLRFQGIPEQIIIKYPYVSKGDTNTNAKLFEKELENDIRTLIKHRNCHGTSILRNVIRTVSDPVLQSNLEHECRLLGEQNEDPHSNVHDDTELTLIFLDQSLLNLSTFQTIGYGIGFCFYFHGFQFHHKIDSTLLQNSKCYEQTFKQVTEFKHKIFFKKLLHSKKLLKGMEFSFTDFKISIFSVMRGKNRNSEVKEKIYEISDSTKEDTNFFMSPHFQKLLKIMLQRLCKLNLKNIGIDILIEFQRNGTEVVQQIIDLFEGSGLRDIQKIFITGSEENECFSLKQLGQRIRIKSLHLQYMSLIGREKEEDNNDCFEEISLFKCYFTPIPLKYFKQLKSFTIRECQFCDSTAEQFIFSLIFEINQNLNVFLEDRMELNFSNEGVQKVLEYRGPIKFWFNLLDQKLKQELIQNQYDQLKGVNYKPLLRYFCDLGDNEQSQMKNTNKIDEKQALSETKCPIQYNPEQSRQIFLNKYEECQQFMYPHHKFQFCANRIPSCCKQLLKSPIQQLPQTQTLASILKNHSFEEYCLFRTSLFQDKFNLKKVHIDLYGNLIVERPVLYDIESIDFIEQLTINQCNIYSSFQVKFLDLLIQLSPKLTKLKIDDIQIRLRDQPEEQKEQELFSNLYHSDLKKFILKGEYSFIDPFLKCLEQSKPQNLVTIKFNCNLQYNIKNEHQVMQEYEKVVALLIQLNKNSLRSLQLFFSSMEVSLAIQECKNLQKLHIINKYKTAELFNNIFCNQELKKVKLTLYKVNYFSNVSSKVLSSIIESLQKEHSHTHTVQIGSFYQNMYAYIEKDTTQISQIFYIIDEINSYFSTGIQKALTIEYLKSFPEQKNLTKLQVVKSSNYSFLNTLFQANQDNQLEIVSFSSCRLSNSDLKIVDFSKMPRSVKYLDFSGNENLSSLEFLDSLYSNIQNYPDLVIDLNGLSIPFSQTYKYLPCLKNILYEYNPFNVIHSLIFFASQGDGKKLKIGGDYYFKAQRTELSEYEKVFFFKYFFSDKIEFMNRKWDSINPNIISPLQLISSDYNVNDCISQVYSKQITDSRFNTNRNIGNKYLLFLACQSERNFETILGYSKSYFNSKFYVQKQLDKQHDTNEKIIPDILHVLHDYILLQEALIKQNLKQIILPLQLELSFDLLHSKEIKTNIDEHQMIDKLSRIPPSELTIDGLSIQFIKTWYVINATSPLTFNTIIKSTDMSLACNSSVGSQLTSNLHRKSFFRQILSGTPQKYRYDDTVYYLSQYFKEQIHKGNNKYLLMVFPLYIFICIFGVVFFSLQFDAKCGQGISWYSYLCYIAYGIISFFVELFLFRKCLGYISHLLPSLEIDPHPGFITSVINSVKKCIIDSPFINQWFIGYASQLVSSQLARFDNFTNVGFLYSTYQCGNYTTFYISLVFMCIPFLHSLYVFLSTVFSASKKSYIPTASLDVYCRICNLLEFKAVSDILDLVSPSNVVVFQGRMFSSRIISSFVRIVGENMPLVILQIYNLSNQKMTSSLVLSLVLSIITFLSLLMSFLTVTPSTLSQEDFNKLNERKRRDQVVEKYESRLQTFEDEMFTLRFYEHLKQLKLNYLNEKKQGNVNLKLANQYNRNMRYFQHLFDCPIEQPQNSEQKEKN